MSDRHLKHQLHAVVINTIAYYHSLFAHFHSFAINFLATVTNVCAMPIQVSTRTSFPFSIFSCTHVSTFRFLKKKVLSSKKTKQKQTNKQKKKQKAIDHILVFVKYQKLFLVKTS